MDLSPIVMQRLWRTRGACFWSLFHGKPGVRTSMEPFHEALADKTDLQWSFDFRNPVWAGARSKPTNARPAPTTSPGTRQHCGRS